MASLHIVRSNFSWDKHPLTSPPLCSRPHSPHSLLFSQSKIILFVRQYWLTSIWQLSTSVGILCDFNHLEFKTVATSRTSITVAECNVREYFIHEKRLMADLESKFTFIHLYFTQRQNFWNIYNATLDMGLKKTSKCDNRNVAETGSFISDSET